jgi:signal peptidase I
MLTLPTRSPENPDLLLTKRILALEGDIVVLHIPNNPMASLLEDYGVDARTRIRVPAGHAWVEGDASAEEDAHLGVGKGREGALGTVTTAVNLGP